MTLLEHEKKDLLIDLRLAESRSNQIRDELHTDTLVTLLEAKGDYFKFICVIFFHHIYNFFSWCMLLLLLSTPLHQRAASRVQHPKSCGSQQSLPPGGKERLHFVGIRPEVQARKGGW